jgi:uncharacterized protein YjbJ (UPF0337 family)
MTTDPNQIRPDIERTQDKLASDVTALAEKTNPRRIAKQPVNKARSAYRGAVDKIMGTVRPAAETTSAKAQSAAHLASDLVSETASTAGETVKAAPHKAGEAAMSIPHMARERTEGSPLAAGMIAFGAGMLISALLPRSEQEQHAAGRMKGMASQYSGKVKQEARGVAQHLGEDMREPAMGAAKSVMSTAGEAAGKVKDESLHTAKGAKEQAQHARQNIK